MICRIKGETGWPFAGTDLVTLDDRLFLRIDDYQFASDLLRACCPSGGLAVLGLNAGSRHPFFLRDFAAWYPNCVALKKRVGK